MQTSCICFFEDFGVDCELKSPLDDIKFATNYSSYWSKSDYQLQDLSARNYYLDLNLQAWGHGQVIENCWSNWIVLFGECDGVEESVIFGRGEKTWTSDLSVPNAARYQLRHTPMIRLGGWAALLESPP